MGRVGGLQEGLPLRSGLGPALEQEGKPLALPHTGPQGTVKAQPLPEPERLSLAFEALRDL